MPTIEQAFAWLVALPSLALYAAAFGFAVVENVVPIIPADAFIGLCAFVAAPGDAAVSVVFMSVLVGNVSGAALTFELGRRYGADGLHRQMEARGWLKREQKLEFMHARYGLLALFIGRLVPGVRPIVPVLAGALRVPAAKTLSVVALATAIWYGSLISLAYHVGGNLEDYLDELRVVGRWAGTGGLVIGAAAAIAIAVWVLGRRRWSK